MTTLTATFPAGGPSQATIVVDGIVTETVTNHAKITEHPVEKGGNVADHIRPEAETLQLELIVSNTPFPSVVEAIAAEFRQTAESTRDTLVAWQAAGALLSFVCTLGARQNMAIESIGTTRTVKDGGGAELTGSLQRATGNTTGTVSTGGLRISLSLKQIFFVNNAMTTATVSKSPRVQKVQP